MASRFIEIEAGYATTCGVCRIALPLGSRVWWRKGDRVRCADCTPAGERRLDGDLEAQARSRDVERRIAAVERRDRFLRTFPFLRSFDSEATAAAEPLLAELAQARDADGIDRLIADIKQLRDARASAPSA